MDIWLSLSAAEFLLTFLCRCLSCERISFTPETLLQSDSFKKKNKKIQKLKKIYPSCKFNAKLWVFLAFKLDAQGNVCDGIEIWVTA